MRASYVRLAVAFALVLLSLGSCAVGAGVAGAASSHGPVTVNGDGGFATCGCVTSGNGTAASPYVIGPYQVGSESPSGGYAVLVENVNVPFEISGISIGYNDLVLSDPVILLSGDTGTAATPIEVSNIDANNDGTGIRIDHSTYVALNDLNINKMNGTGLYIDGSSYISLSNSKLKATSDRYEPSTHGADGLYAVDSSNISIGGVSACPKTQLCNSFDYDSGWGIYLQDTTDSTVDLASGNADDTGGFVLDGSSGVTVENSEAEAGGPICVTVNGAKVSTGYAQDSTDLQGGLMLINGSSDDTFVNDSFDANLGLSISSGGNELPDGAAAYFNPCTNAFEPATIPLDAPMGVGNTFSGVCFTSTNIDPSTLPPNRCK